MRTSLLAAVCLAACASPFLPEPPVSECRAQSIESICKNSTGLIRARVSQLEAPKVFPWRASSTWLTRARLDEVTVAAGRGLTTSDQLYLSGRVETVKPEPLYMFINDATELPPYAIFGCGGVYWPVPSDGGEPLVQSAFSNSRVSVSGEIPGDVISEASFLAQVAACTFAP